MDSSGPWSGYWLQFSHVLAPAALTVRRGASVARVTLPRLGGAHSDVLSTHAAGLTSHGREASDRSVRLTSPYLGLSAQPAWHWEQSMSSAPHSSVSSGKPAARIAAMVCRRT
jgi:hypothetical protein